MANAAMKDLEVIVKHAKLESATSNYRKVKVKTETPRALLSIIIKVTAWTNQRLGRAPRQLEIVGHQARNLAASTFDLHWIRTAGCPCSQIGFWPIESCA